MAKAYGRPSQLLDAPQRVPGDSEVFMWRIGDGILVVETTFSAGIIRGIGYVVLDSEGKRCATLAVKEFNPVTKEMTVAIPNKTSPPDGVLLRGKGVTPTH